MSHSAEKLPGEPIVIRTLGLDTQNEDVQRSAIAADMKLLDEQSEPVFFIVDMTDTVQPSLDHLIVSTDIAARQLKIFHHPKIRQVVIVTTNRMQELGAQGMDSEPYDHIKTKVVGTLDEALAYARSAK